MPNYNTPLDLVTRRYFGGGGGGGRRRPQQTEVSFPEMPAPVYNIQEAPAPEPAPPPPEAQNMSASEAAEQQRQSAAKRDGYRKTILAGETGGYTNPATGSTSLLG
jgi:hypothetical protein